MMKEPAAKSDDADGWFPWLLLIASILIFVKVAWDISIDDEVFSWARLIHELIGELAVAVFIGWVISVGIERAARARDARDSENRRQAIAENVVRGVFGVQYPSSYVQAVIDTHLAPRVVRLSYQAAYTIRHLSGEEVAQLDVLSGRLVAFAATRSFKFRNVSSRSIDFAVGATIPLRRSEKLRSFARMRSVTFDGKPLKEKEIIGGILPDSEIDDHRSYRWVRRINAGEELAVVFDSIMIKELSDTELWWNANPTLESANFSVNVPIGMHFGLQAISSQELTQLYVSEGDGTGTWKIDGPVLPNESVVFWWRSPPDDGESKVDSSGTGGA